MVDFPLYIYPLLVAFSLTVLFQIVFLLTPFFQGALFRRPERRVREKSPVRLGGVAMIMGFGCTILFDPNLVITREISGMLLGIGGILIFGLWDDVKPLNWRAQLFFQVALAILVFLFGIRILTLTNPLGGTFIFPTDGFHFFSFLLLIVWLVLVINSLNWLDGLDGLSGGVALVSLTTIFLLCLKPEVNQPPLALIAAVGMGVVAAFLLFNIHPAKIVAGTVGSVFLGFLVAMLAVLAGTKIATALLVLALPVADACHVLYRRYRAGTSLFLPDRRHLHYRLEELGWKESRITWLFFGASAGIAIVALSTEKVGKLFAIFLALGVIFGILFFVESRYARYKEKKQT